MLRIAGGNLGGTLVTLVNTLFLLTMRNGRSLRSSRSGYTFPIGAVVSDPVRRLL